MVAFPMMKIIVKMFDVNDDDYSELILMKMILMMMMSNAINSSSFLCDCKIKCKPCDQGKISSTALYGLIVTLTFIFYVKAIGHIVHYV